MINEKTTKTSLIFTVFFLLLIISLPVRCANIPYNASFDKLLKTARSYDSNYSKNANRDMAVNYYRAALKQRPNSPENIDIEFRIAQLLGCIYDAKKGEKPRYEEAIQTYEGIINKYPDTQLKYAQSLICSGDHYMWSGMYDKARDKYERILEIDEDRMKLPVNFNEDDGETKEEALERIRDNIKKIKEFCQPKIVASAVTGQDFISSITNLKAIIRKYPRTELARLAEAKLKEIYTRDINLDIGKEISTIVKEIDKEMIVEVGYPTQQGDIAGNQNRNVGINQKVRLGMIQVVIISVILIVFFCYLSRKIRKKRMVDREGGQR